MKKTYKGNKECASDIKGSGGGHIFGFQGKSQSEDILKAIWMWDMASCVSNVFCQYSSQVYGKSRVQEEKTSPCSSSTFEFNKKLIIPA